MTQNTQKYKQNKISSDDGYWADKSMEECFDAVCFMVEQYISWNKLPSRMDKTVFEKTDKHKEWSEENEIWNTFTAGEKAMFKL